MGVATTYRLAAGDCWLMSFPLFLRICALRLPHGHHYESSSSWLGYHFEQAEHSGNSSAGCNSTAEWNTAI
jgi:hypothetical protein